MLTLQETIRPLLLAALGPVLIHAVWIVAFERPALSASLLIVLAMIYGMSLAAGLLFVMPAFALVPTLRQPPVWIAVPWGAFVAILSVVLLGESLELLRWQVSVGFGAAGSVAGLVYALAAQRTHRG